MCHRWSCATMCATDSGVVVSEPEGLCFGGVCAEDARGTAPQPHPFSSLLLFSSLVFFFLVCSCLLGGEAEEFLSRVRSGSSPNTMVWS